MDNEQPRQELVKCVVVGDNAVGKTRLICARACDARVSLSQLMITHIPTVWAIDQYRIDKEVLERSWDVVDGVSVSLRLWDTFGDHDRDRRFAYGRSDVVLLCFSVANPSSLRNCRDMWYPEIRKFCPHAPIFLVGCKNDLRFMYRDPKLLSFYQDRSPFMRPIKECDILTPDQGRAVACEIGAPYYETSVFTNYGVFCVFESIIRAALISRKQQRFWMTNLKRVRRPSLQVPFCPPKPPEPEIYVPESRFESNKRHLSDMQTYTDVIIVAEQDKKQNNFYAHKFFLAAAVPSMYKLFNLDLSSDVATSERRASDSSIVSISVAVNQKFGKKKKGKKMQFQVDVSSVDASVGNFNIDTENLIKDDNCSLFGCSPPCYKLPTFLSSTLSCTSSLNVRDQGATSCTSRQRRNSWETSSSSNLTEGVSRILNHPAYYSIQLRQSDGSDGRERTNPSLQTVLKLSSSISTSTFHQCLIFLYCGAIDKEACDINDLQQAAELMGIDELKAFISNMKNNEDFLNDVLKVNYVNKLRCRLRHMLDSGLFSDVVFQLDGGSCVAHKPLLMAECEMMNAMFGGDFRESSAKVVHFPGVTVGTFRHLLTYLYTDDCANIQKDNYIDLLELSNKLCLSRLVAIVEHRIMTELSKLSKNSHGLLESMEFAIKLLEPSQMYNADQLSEWCLHHLSTNYNEVCRHMPKLLRNLHPENQAYLNKNRWPPVWYLKECDHYERCQREREREEKPLKVLKRHQNSSGCLCFCGKARKNSDTDKHYRTM
ncbi:Rho-related BTB domain-containing protein 2 [Nymphon striatum]|nr:Rho-related BTB domain-containing protein 2 [Nymphon striatum]